MKQFINKNRIIEAFILEPYTNTGEQWEVYPSRGWQLALVVGYTPDGYQHKIVIDKESEDECLKLAKDLDLTIVI